MPPCLPTPRQPISGPQPQFLTQKMDHGPWWFLICLFSNESPFLKVSGMAPTCSG